MTKDELRKEATSTVEWENTPMLYRPLFVLAYIAGAEPREKRIANLEMTIGTLRNFSNEQATCIEKLEAQIEKMKCCRNCKYDGGLVCLYKTDCKNRDKWELAD